MERKVLTWKDLADKIDQMTEEEKGGTVKVWGSELQFCDDVVLAKESEDMCCD